MDLRVKFVDYVKMVTSSDFPELENFQHELKSAWQDQIPWTKLENSLEIVATTLPKSKETSKILLQKLKVLKDENSNVIKIETKDLENSVKSNEVEDLTQIDENFVKNENFLAKLESEEIENCDQDLSDENVENFCENDFDEFSNEEWENVENETFDTKLKEFSCDFCQKSYKFQLALSKHLKKSYQIYQKPTEK